MGLVHVAIRVKDLDESLKFYRYLGLRVMGRRSHMPGEEIVMLIDKSTGQRLNLMWYARDCKLYTPWKENGVELDHLMFNVKDAKKTYNALLKKGMKPAMELREREIKGKKMAMGFIKDPNGIWVGIVSGISLA